MKKKIVIAGGTGFIGQYLQRRFAKEGFTVIIISRDTAHVSWDGDDKLIEALNGAEVLINLAGKSVDCRYTESNKELMMSSRVDTTLRLQSLVEKCAEPPKLWVNSSTATIYRHAEDRPMDEEGGEIGKGYSVEVAKAWEEAFFRQTLPLTRKLALRIAIVLGKGGGVIKPYANLTKFGLGGKQGNGGQMFSWIHIEDVFRIIRFAMKNQELKGVLNAAAPHPVTNKVLMKTFREILKPVIHLSSPTWLLKIGAYLIKTETELVLKSRWVVPERLEAVGFQFKFEKIGNALGEILS